MRGPGSNRSGSFYAFRVSENWVSRKLVNREGRSRALVLVPTRTNYLLTERVSRVIIQPTEKRSGIAIDLHPEEEQQ